MKVTLEMDPAEFVAIVQQLTHGNIDILNKIIDQGWQQTMNLWTPKPRERKED